MNYSVIEAQIRYLTTEEGGRNSPVASGYRGQFHYDGNDYDGFQFFPDHPTQLIELGDEVRAFVRFNKDRWEQVHRHNLCEGKTFQIREGSRVVGEGTVTRLDVPTIEFIDVSKEN